MTLFWYLLGYKVKRVTCKIYEALHKKFTHEPALLYIPIKEEARVDRAFDPVDDQKSHLLSLSEILI